MRVSLSITVPLDVGVKIDAEAKERGFNTRSAFVNQMIKEYFEKHGIPYDEAKIPVSNDAEERKPIE